MKNLKFDQFYKGKSLFMIKRSQNFRLRRAKQTTDREIHCLKIVSAKIVHMAKSRKKHCGGGFWLETQLIPWWSPYESDEKTRQQHSVYCPLFD